jgi:hypothetical protein
MTRLHVLRAPAALLLALAPVSVASARAQEPPAPFRYETQKVDDALARRAGALAAALGFASWPRTSELYALPAVSRALLRDPARVTEEVRACTTIPFGDGAWPQCTWSWKGLGEGRKPAPADWLDLQITVAPSARGAQEHLLGSIADSQMPTEMVVARYTSAERPANLGHVAFVVESARGHETTVSFLRANLAFRIRGHGALAAEALPLAARLDERVLGQPPLTLEDLRTRSAETLRRR